MPIKEATTWATAAAVAGALAWAAYRGPPPRPGVSIAEPLNRQATQQEVALVRAQAADMTTEIQGAYQKVGQYPSLQSLEGGHTSGTQWLSHPIPDNPLVPGVATVGTSCGEPDTRGGPRDWWYCPQTGHIQPGGVQSGNE